MKHSEAYISFMKQVRAKGSDKLDGYDLNLLSVILPEERKKVERIIWRKYPSDIGLACLMPKLEFHDGISALKKGLKTLPNPGEDSAVVALILYETTSEEQYLELAMQNYNGLKNGTQRLAVVSTLERLAKDPKVYPLLREIYLHDADETCQTAALCGMLWHDGILQDINNPNEFSENIELIKSYTKKYKESAK